MSVIFVDCDNSDPRNKVFSAIKAGKSAAKAEEKMQKAVKAILKNAPGFTTTKPPKAEDAKGYQIRFTVSKVESAGHRTNCGLNGAIAIYPLQKTKSGAEGVEMLTRSMTGNGWADGTSENAILDCIEAIAEDLTTKAVPIMRTDFAKRHSPE
jgi:hypothetical protein